jgi:hypothetical protein
MWHAWDRWEMHTKNVVGKSEGRDHFENLDVDGKIIWERILGK